MVQLHVTLSDLEESEELPDHERITLHAPSESDLLVMRELGLTRPGGEYAAMKPGFVISYSATRAANWTGTRPTPPAKLPF